MADPPGLRLPFPGLEAINVQNLGFRRFVLDSSKSYLIDREEEEVC